MTAVPRLFFSFVLLASPVAHAQEPDAGGGAKTDELTANAEKHVLRAYELSHRGAYADAEEEFKRAAFYSPRWRPLHFNIGVLAEAQGKIRSAIHEYETFKQYATTDEGLLVEQRILELTDRRRKIVKVYRRQITAGAVMLSIGLGVIAGGCAFLGLYVAGDEEFKKTHKGYIGGSTMLLYGALISGGGGVALAKSVKSKRRLDGIALGPTRLRWAGGTGFALRF